MLIFWIADYEITRGVIDCIKSRKLLTWANKGQYVQIQELASVIIGAALVSRKLVKSQRFAG